jgi:hypothetical protein
MKKVNAQLNKMNMDIKRYGISIIDFIKPLKNGKSNKEE